MFKSMSLTLSGNPVGAMKACLDALGPLRARIARYDECLLRVEAKTPVSFFSWGTLLHISLKRVNIERTEVRISADTVLPITVCDFGHNARVLRRIKRHLLGL